MRQARDRPAGEFRIVLEIEVRRAACLACGTMKRE